MNEPTEKNVELVINSLEEVHKKIIESNSLDLKNFVDFMEKIFTQAGYRTFKNFSEQKNILILHDAAAGDFIIQSGTIREIRRLYPTAHITLVVTPQAFELAKFCPYVDEIILNEKENNPVDIISFFKWDIEVAKKILPRRFDVCYAFSQWAETPLLMYMSGARARVTYSPPKNSTTWLELNGEFSQLEFFLSLVNFPVPMNFYGTHMAECCFSLVDNTLHSPVANREIEVWYNHSDLKVVKSFLKKISPPLYALSMGGSHMTKHYPPEKYSEFVQIVLKENPKSNFIILGGGQIDSESAEIFKNNLPEVFHKNIFDLTNKLNYRQSAAALKKCKMYIGNDTGTVHAAAAVKCPVLEINCFPADLPRSENNFPILWSPYRVPNVIVQPEHALPECREVYFSTIGCMRGNFPHCITQIKPEKIFEAFHILQERIKKNILETFYFAG